jgi:hypothetical protein
MKTPYNYNILEETKYAVLAEVFNNTLTEVEHYLVALKYTSCMTGECMSLNYEKYFNVEEEARADFEQRKGICLY